MQVHQNSNIYPYLNFFVAVRLVTCRKIYPQPNSGCSVAHGGARTWRGLSPPGRG